MIKHKLGKRRLIRIWMKSHKGFVRMMNRVSSEIAKGSWGPDVKFNVKFLRRMLQDMDYLDCLPFTPNELFCVWRK